ncbi:MAG: helix-turn-helix domain-containing protein [Oscillospiraceae bacterium]|jgi:transcriptional regulator with XRE-family HTH domain|nr:helix-turn-helix domain-containing protein [Oscillospiraceae bacterium]
MENWQGREMTLAPGESREWIQRLFKIMKKRKMTKKELAGKSKISSSAITDWFTKNREPRYTNIQKLTEALDISPNYFFGKHDCENPKNNFIQLETGLTEEAIKKLRTLNKRDSNHWKIEIISILIENHYEEETDLFAHLFRYLTNQYMIAGKIVYKDKAFLGLLEGAEFDTTPYNKDLLELAELGFIQNDVVQLKKDIPKDRIEELRLKTNFEQTKKND